MPHSIQLSLAAARNVMLASMGLLPPPQRPAEKADVLTAIRQMGVLQLDTIHVVARSPYFVLWSHLGAYQPAWLDELLAEGCLFEYWSHAACLIPSEDFPIYRRIMLEGMDDWRDPANWLHIHPDLISGVLERIRSEGPLRSADFENPRKDGGGWWNWKEEKQALEHLFTAGELMVARREKFQRIYDLRERVRPEWDDRLTPSLEEAHRSLTLKAVHCLGVALPNWVPDYFRLPKRGTLERLDQLTASGELLPIAIDGWDSPAYLHPERLPLVEAALRGDLQPSLTTLLSPFDPLVWDRARAKALFGFDYTIECYLPAEKRRYGYFSLPILHQGALVGRVDAKAYRKEGIFEVRSLYLEPGVEPTQELAAALAAALQRCADWHATPQVKLLHADPPGMGDLLAEVL
jgi:hypothetical protein